MAVPHITQLPPPPSRATDSKDVFTAKADAVLAAQQQFVAQTNELGDYVEQRAGSAESAAGASAASAVQSADSALAASQQVGLASEQVGLAELEADRAEAAQEQAEIAAAAAGAAAGLPALAGQAGRFMQVLPDESGVRWGASQQEIGDVLLTSRTPDSDYLSANGGIFLQSAYPDLFGIIGAQPDSFGNGWTQRPGIGGSSGQPHTITKGVFAFLGPSGNYRSTDGGKTWIRAGDFTGDDNYASSATDFAGKCVVLHSSPTGPVRYTTDGGLTWPAVSVSFTADTYNPSIQYDGSGGWFRFGASSSLNNTVLNRSFDNGATWGANILLGSPNVAQAACDGAGNWLCGQAGSTAIRRSADNGVTWSAAATLPASSSSGADIQLIATDRKGVWIIAAPAGDVFRSEDIGTTWTRFNTNLASSSGIIRVVYDQTADMFVVCNPLIGVATSRDGGKTWFPQPAVAGTGFSGRLLSDGAGTFLIGGSSSSGPYQTSAPDYGYDKNTQFKTPRLSVGSGASAYIKAKEVI